MYKNNFPIKKWAEEDRPREKLLLKGRSNLSNAEIMAIIIGSGTRDLSAVELSKQILAFYKNDLQQMGRVGVADFKKFKGIGEAKAVTIVAALELGRRRQHIDVKEKPKVVSSKQAFACIQSAMVDLNHEEFKIILLNRANRVVKIETISIGGISQTVVDPKVIFKRALDVHASSIILVHNHPSGNLKPSEADLSLTKSLVKAGDLLDISIIDHLIVSQEGYYSFADEGEM